MASAGSAGWRAGPRRLGLGAAAVAVGAGDDAVECERFDGAGEYLEERDVEGEVAITCLEGEGGRGAGSSTWTSGSLNSKRRFVVNGTKIVETKSMTWSQMS